MMIFEQTWLCTKQSKNTFKPIKSGNCEINCPLKNFQFIIKGSLFNLLNLE